MRNLPAIRPSHVPSAVSPLQLYLQEIARYPLLEPEEEYALAEQHFQTGDVISAHRLVTSNLRLVVKIASDFQKAQTSLLDLIQEGNHGLMLAVKKFNPYKGVRLSSYAAWWIKAYILKYLMDNQSQVKIGTTAAQRKLFYNLKREAERLLSEYDRADPKLIAASLNVKESDVVEMQKRLQGKDLSLDAPLNSNDESSMTQADILSDNHPRIDEVLATAEIEGRFQSYLSEFKETLNERDLSIFETRILAETPLTLHEVGERYGITRERARQLESKIIQKLKSFLKDKGTLDIELT